jgi:hypothetical protein
MNRPRLVRLLRIGWSAGWVITCLLLIAMWVRSYWQWDSPSAWSKQVGLVAQINSTEGQIQLVVYQYPTTPGLSEWPTDSASVKKPAFRAHWLANPPGISAYAPHWFPVLLFATFAAAPWLRWRFSLRTLLIATTLVAVVLGLIVWMR